MTMVTMTSTMRLYIVNKYIYYNQDIVKNNITELSRYITHGVFSFKAQFAFASNINVTVSVGGVLDIIS